MKGPVLILGATSAIARAAASAFAARGCSLYLAGRDTTELERIAADLTIRYRIDVHQAFFDADRCEEHEAFLSRVRNQVGNITGVLLAFGFLGEKPPQIGDIGDSAVTFGRNLVGAVSVLELCAKDFDSRREGFIAGISSVAGDRGRQSNYLYCAAKAGFSTYLQGLRNRLFPSGVHVLTIKPGFVDTSMTYGRPGVFLTATPESVGEKIVRAIEQRRDVVYIPWFWRYIMLVVKLIPESVFKRMKM
jgi:decaprenylphospho-beta-D-erythro-pentofuranosid-2-ulose 2-reductase